MVQVGSNPLSSASSGPKLSPRTKDFTSFEPSCIHRNKHCPGLACQYVIFLDAIFLAYNLCHQYEIQYYSTVVSCNRKQWTRITKQAVSNSRHSLCKIWTRPTLANLHGTTSCMVQPVAWYNQGSLRCTQEKKT